MCSLIHNQGNKPGITKQISENITELHVRVSLSYPAGTLREFGEIYSNSERNPTGNDHKFNLQEEEEETKAGA